MLLRWRPIHNLVRPGKMRHLSFFVYGTLLPGQPNYKLLTDAIIDQQPALFARGRLHDMGYYPALVEDSGPVKGLAIAVHPARHDEVLGRLDRLEGFNPERPEDSAFYRDVRSVQLSDASNVAAWLYLCRPWFVHGAPVIPSGDWIAHVRAYQAAIDDWWEALGRGSPFGNSA